MKRLIPPGGGGRHEALGGVSGVPLVKCRPRWGGRKWDIPFVFFRHFSLLETVLILITVLVALTLTRCFFWLVDHSGSGLKGCPDGHSNASSTVFA